MSFYLDHNATTRMYQGAIDAMTLVQRDTFGNASSVHAEGQAARSTLEGARSSIAGMIGCKPKELYFTSGGTEANNWVFHSVLETRQGWGALASAVEHKSLLRAASLYAWHTTEDRLEVDAAGVIDLDFLETAVKDSERANLVSVMLANNETGVIQPVREVSDIVKKYHKDSLVHTDAVQAFGKIPVNVEDLGVDLMTLSAHKVGGPKGVGALYIREGIDVEAMILGGHQEHDRRAGTENVAGAVGFQVAASHMIEHWSEHTKIVYGYARGLLEKLYDGIDDIWVNGGDSQRLPNTVNVGFPGVESDALVLILSGLGILVSNGSACEAGSLEGSHVLKAMGQSDVKSKSAIRFSFSDDLPDGAIDLIAESVIESVKVLRSMAQITL